VPDKRHAMGLTQRILLLTGLLIVALVGTTLAFTTWQANVLAQRSIRDGLGETQGVWETFQSDRYAKLKLGVRALANDPYFKAYVETGDEASVADSLQERGADIAADVFVATDAGGVVIARSDRPGAQGEDLSRAPVVARALEGEESATIWQQGERLYHTVALPMVTLGELKGVLVAGYAIDEAVAGSIRRLTGGDVTFLAEADGRPRLSVSSLGPKESALRARLEVSELPAADAQPFELTLAGEHMVAVRLPLVDASQQRVGSVLALRSLDVELAAFRSFRNSLVLVALVVMALALAAATFMAQRITGPVRKLVDLVERAREGSYTGAVSVQSSDEIGVLARAFNRLLADLREKEQLIAFLNEGMTEMRRGQASGATETLATTATAELPVAGTVPAAAAARLERGAVFAGRYEILGGVGKGGMGIVYRARDRQLDEVVALKLLRPETLVDDSTQLERFKTEIRLARKVTHRNVLRTHDFGESGGIPYISMEYLEGVSLKELIRSRGALPLGVGLRIAKQIAQGLEAAHHQGVVHRDVKPQNILILPESGEVKIMDFGIARVSEMKGGGLTTTGTVMGTPDYIPPEQAQGQPADFRSDIYSLGVVLFEMFAGRLPFVADSAMAVILAHIQTQPPRPREINPRLPASLEAAILRCLAKEPAARYADVERLLQDLGSVSAETEPDVA
jgi:methyl-accepting chemotaxis protein